MCMDCSAKMRLTKTLDAHNAKRLICAKGGATKVPMDHNNTPSNRTLAPPSLHSRKFRKGLAPDCMTRLCAVTTCALIVQPVTHTPLVTGSSPQFLAPVVFHACTQTSKVCTACDSPEFTTYLLCLECTHALLWLSLGCYLWPPVEHAECLCSTLT